MLSEWHLPPDYIVTNWTDELLDLMVSKMVIRHKRISEAMASAGQSSSDDTGTKIVSDAEFLKIAGNVIKVKKE